MSKSKRAPKLNVSPHLSKKPGLIGKAMPMMNSNSNMFSGGGLST